MIDPATYERYQQAQSLAKERGFALIEVLDKQRLLLTPAEELAIQLKVLDELLRRLDLQTSNRLLSFYLGRAHGTPAEMLEAIKMWVGTVRQNMSNRTLEDL